MQGYVAPLADPSQESPTTRLLCVRSTSHHASLKLAAERARTTSARLRQALPEARDLPPEERPRMPPPFLPASNTLPFGTSPRRAHLRACSFWQHCSALSLLQVEEGWLVGAFHQSFGTGRWPDAARFAARTVVHRSLSTVKSLGLGIQSSRWGLTRTWSCFCIVLKKVSKVVGAFIGLTFGMFDQFRVSSRNARYSKTTLPHSRGRGKTTLPHKNNLTTLQLLKQLYFTTQQISQSGRMSSIVMSHVNNRHLVITV